MTGTLTLLNISQSLNLINKQITKNTEIIFIFVYDDNTTLLKLTTFKSYGISLRIYTNKDASKL